MKSFIQKWWLTLLFMGVVAVAYFFLKEELTIETLHAHRKEIKFFVDNHAVTPVLVFLIFFTPMIGLSLPFGGIAAITAGFCFAHPWASILAVTTMTLGAIIAYKLARTKLFHGFHNTPQLIRIVSKLRTYPAANMLMLRVVPIMPFWLINLAAALAKIPLSTYIWTTIVGLIPATFVYCLAGDGLAEIFDSDQNFSWSHLANGKIIAALIIAGALCTLPLLIRLLRGRL